jgi:predicted NUDIX family phosphoesterase
MGDFLKAAYHVLSQNKKPLSAKEIVVIALKKNFLETAGKTPWQTMKSKLSSDILRYKDKSIFMRSSAGKFALRDWKNNLPEHIAPRYTMALFDEDIMVFPASILKNYITKIGVNESLKTENLLSECYPMRRKLAEEDLTVIQLVSFYIVRYKNTYLTYKRTKRLPESRLHGTYSLGFGGHLNPDDIPSLFNFVDPEQALTFIFRELREELILKVDPEVKFRGLIYDDSREVSKQHIGLVYDVSMTSPQYEIGERGFLIDSKFETLKEILNRSKEFENWSVLIAQEELRRA